MTAHPDPEAQAIDTIALGHSGARQLIRFATAAEEKRYREIYPLRVFSLLIVVVTPVGDMHRLNFVEFKNPSGEVPLLPSCPSMIANIDAGRCMLTRTALGLEVVGYQAGLTPEIIKRAMALPIGGER